MVFFALLAAGDHGISLVIGDEQGQHVFPGVQEACDLKGKRNVTAAVATGFPAVHKQHAIVIHRPEMQKDMSEKLFLGDLHGTAVPSPQNEILIFHPGKLALGTEGHGDLPGKGVILFRVAAGNTRSAVVYLELPKAVQILPSIAHPLRAGMLRSGNVVHRVASL